MRCLKNKLIWKKLLLWIIFKQYRFKKKTIYVEIFPSNFVKCIRNSVRQPPTTQTYRHRDIQLSISVRLMPDRFKLKIRWNGVIEVALLNFTQLLYFAFDGFMFSSGAQAYIRTKRMFVSVIHVSLLCFAISLCFDMVKLMSFNYLIRINAFMSAYQ